MTVNKKNAPQAKLTFVAGPMSAAYDNDWRPFKSDNGGVRGNQVVKGRAVL